MKRILVIVGEIGSGKGTFAELLTAYFEGKTVELLDFSQIMKETLDLWFLERTRENYRKLTNLMEHNFGRGTLSHALNKKVENSPAEIVLVTGARRTVEIDTLKKLSNCSVIYVTAEPKIRFERTRARKEKIGEHSTTFEQFISEHQEDTEKEIPEIGQNADITIENNGNLEDLEKQIKNLELNNLELNS
jgi:dephospho-CoA kinase